MTHIKDISIAKIRSCFARIYYLLVCTFFISICASTLWTHISVRPIFFLIPLYFGVVYNHPQSTAGIMFCVSLMHDAVFGYPIGTTGVVSAMCTLLLITLRSKLNTQDPLVTFIGFSATAITFCFLLWIFTSLHNGIWSNLISFFPDITLTIIALPLAAKTFYLITGLIRYT